VSLLHQLHLHRWFHIAGAPRTGNMPAFTTRVRPTVMNFAALGGVIEFEAITVFAFEPVTIARHHYLAKLNFQEVYSVVLFDALKVLELQFWGFRASSGLISFRAPYHDLAFNGRPPVALELASGKEVSA
jgi:hypothetical protein